MMKFFVKTVKRLSAVNYLAKNFVLDVGLGFEWAFDLPLLKRVCERMVKESMLSLAFT